MNDRKRYALQQAIAILNTVGIIPVGEIVHQDGKQYLAVLIEGAKLSDIGFCGACGDKLENCKGSNERDQI